MIRFKCSHCGARMEVDETYVGHPGRCPTCGASITVPAASTVSSPSGGMVGAGMPQGRTAGTTIRVHGEEVSVRAPLETTAIASIVLMGLSVVLFVGIWLSGKWAPALGVGALLAMLMAILSVLVAVTAYHNVRRSRGLRRGMGAAYAGLIGGASLFLIFLIVTAWSFVMHANRPSCEANLRTIWTALSEYADSHDEKFPPNLAELARDTSLKRASLTCPKYRVREGDQTYQYIAKLNRRDFTKDIAIVFDGRPWAHKDRKVRVLLIGGDVTTVQTKEWDTYAAAQQSKAEDILRALLDKDKPKTGEMFPDGAVRPAPPDAGDTDLPEDAGEASP